MANSNSENSQNNNLDLIDRNAVPSLDFVSVINDVKSNEPKNESNDSLTPFRAHNAKNLREMYLLKQFEDILSLYDENDIIEESDAETVVNTVYKKRQKANYRNGFLSLGVLALFIRSKNQCPLKISSYINNVYYIPLIIGLSYTTLRFLNVYFSKQALYSIQDDYFIKECKARLHTYSVQITNELKYDLNDLL